MTRVALCSRKHPHLTEDELVAVGLKHLHQTDGRKKRLCDDRMDGLHLQVWTRFALLRVQRSTLTMACERIRVERDRTCEPVGEILQAEHDHPDRQAAYASLTVSERIRFGPKWTAEVLKS